MTESDPATQTEYCIANDEGVIEDGFYSEKAARKVLAIMTERDEDEGCHVDFRDRYDRDGQFMDSEDE